jgi:hypothetical protein
MPGIDPNIVIHEIKTYPVAKPIRQNLLPIHPRKAAAINMGVEFFLKPVLFIMYLLLIRFQIFIMSQRNKVRYAYVLIIGISIGLVLKITTQPLSLTRSLIIVLVVKYSHLWMVSSAIIKLIYYHRINTKPISFVLGYLCL